LVHAQHADGERELSLLRRHARDDHAPRGLRLGAHDLEPQPLRARDGARRVAEDDVTAVAQALDELAREPARVRRDEEIHLAARSVLAADLERRSGTPEAECRFLLHFSAGYTPRSYVALYEAVMTRERSYGQGYELTFADRFGVWLSAVQIRRAVRS